ncbi:DUF6443 domain-containing protein [Sphingobacterium spiritivorum]|uniref:DUF6443 domain-containing protein n=1 Tax=Sphingobacterium spiritivorum TaxID=258 RepID=UPI0036A1C564
MKIFLLFTGCFVLNILCLRNGLAQEHKTLVSYNGQNLIEAKKSITLKSGFHIPSGSNVVLRVNPSGGDIPYFNTFSDQDHNYIMTRDLLIPGITKANVSEARKANEEKREIKYYDGLGRIIQQIQVKGSPNYNDIVQHFSYDSFGRETLKYLLYSANEAGDGKFKTSAGNDILNYYNGAVSWDASVVKTAYPYAEIVFENSPLNRAVKKGNQGADWQPVTNTGNDHSIKTSYGTNSLNEVKQWVANLSGNGANAIMYKSGQLFKTIVRNENVPIDQRAGSVEEFKDFDGNIVLVRIWETEVKSLSTYYVYDYLGNILYVLPPAVNENGIATLDNAFNEEDFKFKEYIYGYKYDKRKRLIEKKIPGKQKEYLIYNKLDQLILTQDGNQRTKGEWSYSRYDAFGRIASTGIYKNTVYTSAESIRNIVDSFTGPLWESRNGHAVYFNNTFPVAENGVSISERLVNYYDDYNFEGASFLPFVNISKSEMINSLQTGSKVYKEDGSDPLFSVIYYDDRGRVLQTASQNHLTGTDYVTNTYNFAGELLVSTHLHKSSPSASVTQIITKNEFDHMGRPTSIKQQINSQNLVTISTNNYNEIGQLVEKQIGADYNGGNSHANIQYTYNERGWLNTSISDFFSLKLKYGDGNTPQWNGNISEQQWGQTALPGEKFVYEYDQLSRLKNGTSPSGMSELLNYDEMGNITKLIRDGASIHYTYSGNKLSMVSGIANGNYAYDNNGNVSADRNGLNYVYTHFNIPKAVNGNGKTISYLYDANGIKLRKISNETGRRDYIGNIEYQNGNIAMIRHAEGVAILKTDGTYIYHYNLTDHLGNVRATLYRNPATNQVEALQRDDYYPFGLRKVLKGGNNKYLYNGKEIQGELGDQYDYGARFYDPVIARWGMMDLLAEKFAGWSPYNYTMDNPINLIDPTGMAPEDWVLGKFGNIYWDKNATSQATTKAGETYLGRDLIFTFNSYIDADLWDGPLGSFPAGNKISSTINVSANTDTDNNLLSINVNSDEPKINKTGGWIPTDNYYPGETNYKVNKSGLNSGQKISYEQHAKVNFLEEVGLSLMGYDKVNVAQKLTIGLNGNNLGVEAATDIFPSASLSVKGTGNSNSYRLMNYKQPSFKNTHKTNIVREGSMGAMPVTRTTSTKPAAAFFNDIKNRTL